ncbi:MAG: SDR family oxidoreductase [Candidatus Thermoplasmatota archaeon]|nr:SDR family oxidoreductase [Candidatus Thermoplasmatota archaeon]
MLNGKIVIITGATSGIGKETALGLAKLSATIIITTRDDNRGNEIKNEIIQTTDNKNIGVFHCDLASFESIRNFCRKFKTKYHQLHVLINYVGTWHFKRRESKDGIENIFATNYLAPFLMTSLLLDVIQKSKPARIINLTSGLHYGTINFDDIEFKHNFSGMKAYSQSKLAIILFTRLLAKKLEGKGVTVNCVNPGMSKTNLGRDAGTFSRNMFKILGKDPKKGAETSIYLASSKEVENITGEYFVKKKIKKLSKEFLNMEVAKKLWNISTKYVKL